MIDTPGMRELKLAPDDAAVETSFADIQVIVTGCRFSDCAHQNEPGCAVLAALSNGQISADRWYHYQRLLAEQRQQSRRAEAVHERREREKTFAKMAKRVQRGKALRKKF